MAVAVVSAGGTSIIYGMFATEILLEALKDKGVIKSIIPPKTFAAQIKVKMPDDLTKHSGTYANTGVSADINVKDGELVIPLVIGGMAPEQKYAYTGDGNFANNDGSVHYCARFRSGCLYIFRQSEAEAKPD